MFFNLNLFLDNSGKVWLIRTRKFLFKNTFLFLFLPSKKQGVFSSTKRKSLWKEKIVVF